MEFKRDILQFLLGSFVGLTMSFLFVERNNIFRYVSKFFKKLNKRTIKEFNKKKKCVGTDANIDEEKKKEKEKETEKEEKKKKELKANTNAETEKTNNADFDPNVPEHCPGVNNELAGKAKACEGCPNRNICNDDKLKTEKVKIVTDIEENLKNVNFKILILSGKGGVGKSTIATQIAFSLSYLNYEIGLLDIDICGPSVPILTNTINSDVNYSMSGWVPIYKNNLSIMSIGYLLPDFDDAVIWRGPKKNGLIKQFLSDVCWKNLDFLIIDTPPGTSDEHLTICSYMKNNLNGCLIVTTPHILSIYDVKKEIEFCKKTNMPILGVVENMYQPLFVSNDYTVQKMCEEMEVPYAGKITFHEDLIAACKNGIGCCDMNVTTNTSKEIFNVCKFLIQQMIKQEEKNTENNSNGKETPSKEYLLNAIIKQIDQYI